MVAGGSPYLNPPSDLGYISAFVSLKPDTHPLPSCMEGYKRFPEPKRRYKPVVFTNPGVYVITDKTFSPGPTGQLFNSNY